MNNPEHLLLHNTYSLLAHFLAPVKSEQRLNSLKTAIKENKIEWGPLVYQANLQMCSPLWFVRLKQDGLLQYLPEDLQEYLQFLYDANTERNEKLKNGAEVRIAAGKKPGVKKRKGKAAPPTGRPDKIGTDQ